MVWPIMMSPEVFHQHQVFDRGVHAGKKNRATVRSCGDAGRPIAEAASHYGRPSGGKVEILQARFGCRPVDIVDAPFVHFGAPPNYAIEHFLGPATGNRHSPERTTGD